MNMKSTEQDPNGLNSSEPGAKLDAGKPAAGVLWDFSRALSAVADVGTFGAKKYSRGGWQFVENGIERYTDAMTRHLLKENIEPYDPDTNLPHEFMTAWNALARLELMLREQEYANDQATDALTTEWVLHAKKPVEKEYAAAI